MNKIMKGVICAGLCCTLFASFGCKKSGLDSETRPLKLGTAAVDGNFNPFAYTAQTDGNMIGYTQIGMLTNDADGNIVCGQDWATVALNYKSTSYTTKQVGTGEVCDGSTEGRTEYEFVIKNGLKFSDGVDLTIKDVLFNLYVYLDPAYTGSATIYSTDIQGLKAYRAQDAQYTDESDLDLDSGFLGTAQARINKLIDWSQDYSVSGDPTDAQMKADLATTLKYFHEEVETDWTSVVSGWKDTYKEYNFTAAWQAFLFAEGLVSVQTRLDATTNGYVRVKEGDKYLTTLDPNASGVGTEGEVQAQQYINRINDATTEELISAEMSKSGADRATAIENLQRAEAIDIVYSAYSDQRAIANILQYWATATTVLNEFIAEARTDYYEEKKAAGEGVDSISGITTYTATGAELSSSFNGLMTETYVAGETYSVLKIVINGVDPRAKYNFAFTVSPLHYYSGTYKGKDYVAAANGIDEFGVEVGDSNFFNQVIKDTAKNGLPVGAGPYMASSENGGAAKSSSDFNPGNNIIYFQRNEYFETVGTGVDNAKIKYLRFQVTSDDQIISKLQTQELDYGEPNATPSNKASVNSISYLSQETYLTGGYGYVGVNPKFVPEVAVRQAIMKAMNTNLIIKNYYTSDLASLIYRPVSKTSWAYDNTWSKLPDNVAYTTDDNVIVALVESAGYKKGSDGVYAKNGKKLKFTFTIAGESSDHPAFAMFTDASDRLNALGFDTSVSTSSQALKDLSNGNLAVWAAAWSSAADPDPYQLYHKDSKAASVNNWNYTNILKDYDPDNDKWTYEYPIIMELSDLIDQGRETTVESARKTIYAQCYDKIMSLAVELPTYQRNDLCIYNNEVLDRATMTKQPSFNMGLISEIWKLDYVK